MRPIVPAPTALKAAGMPAVRSGSAMADPLPRASASQLAALFANRPSSATSCSPGRTKGSAPKPIRTCSSLTMAATIRGRRGSVSSARSRRSASITPSPPMSPTGSGAA